jgi:acylphosphatase
MVLIKVLQIFEMTPFTVSAKTEALKMKLKGTVQNLGHGICPA